MSLLAYALTTLARQKSFMGISNASNDTLLTNLINSCTDFIEKYCDRRFKQTAYSDELYDGKGSNELLLKNYPVATGETFSIEQRNSTLSNSGFNAIQSQNYHVRENGLVTRVNAIFERLPQYYRINYTAGFDFDNVATYLSDAGAADLEFACWRLVSKAFNQINQAGNVRSESLGDYSVTFLKELFADQELRSIIGVYRRPFGG